MLGHGRNSAQKVSVDINCRMDLDELKKGLEDCFQKKIPVVGVVAVFGTTQEGAVDNLEKLLSVRKDYEKRGMTFYIHVDGAWGGYFASCIVNNKGQRNKAYNTQTPSQRLPLTGPETVEKRNNLEAKRLSAKSPTSPTKRTGGSVMAFMSSKLSSHFHIQLSCLDSANSITLDPHKSGFCPYPAGGLLYRNGNIRNFLAQKAAYVSHGTGKNEEINLYGIDGSKPGAQFQKLAHIVYYTIFRSC